MSDDRKPVLAVDVDEVIAYFIPSLAAFHNEKFAGDITLTADSFFSYDFCKVWGGTMEDSYVKMDAFYLSDHFTEKLSPIPDALEGLLELKKDFDLHIVTSRQFAIQDHTMKWIEQHYPGVFTEVHFGNHYSRAGKVRSKPEICQEIGAVLLIDDSLQYAMHCYKAKIPVLLFGDYAWNQKHSVCSTLFDDHDVHIHTFDEELHGAQGCSVPVNSLFRVLHWRDMSSAIKCELAKAAAVENSST